MAHLMKAVLRGITALHMAVIRFKLASWAAGKSIDARLPVRLGFCLAFPEPLHPLRRNAPPPAQRQAIVAALAGCSPGCPASVGLPRVDLSWSRWTRPLAMNSCPTRVSCCRSGLPAPALLEAGFTGAGAETSIMNGAAWMGPITSNGNAGAGLVVAKGVDVASPCFHPRASGHPPQQSASSVT
jgi:hypothetical protein